MPARAPLYHRLGVALLLGVESLAMSSAPGQTWTQTSAPTNRWTGLACSADGTRLVAVAGGQHAPGPIYTSSDSGSTWVSNTVAAQGWIAACSSADGTKLAVAANNGVWTNAGISWGQAAALGGAFYPSSIACSADGKTLLAQNSAANISTDFGRSWTSRSSGGAEGCAVSADGTRMLALGSNPYVSTNTGVTWTNYGNLIWTEFRAAATSADGFRLTALADAGVWVSADGGITWTRSTNAPTSSYGSIASSADGTRLVLARRLSVLTPLFVSTNAGLTWETASAPSNTWATVCSSADGNLLAAAADNGGIWVCRTPPAPHLQLATARTNLLFSWLVPSPPMMLQRSLNLVSWVGLTNSPRLNLTNLQNQLLLQRGSNGMGFYRLAQPGP